MSTVLITGASRGIGLELTRQYAEEGWRVLACCRTPDRADALKQLPGDIVIQGLDVDDLRSVQAARQALEGETIDVLLNNAGVIGQRDSRLGNMDYDSWAGCLNTNVLGPMRVSDAFTDLVLKSKQKKIATVSSRMGSIGVNESPDGIVYRSSKAAVNMVMKCLANDLADKGGTVLCFHPGWVQTDMGGPNAAVAPVDSAAGMRAVIANATTADNGKFFNFDGDVIPW
jgi:NAD(P)-dependent dehydrogenase (short-subunit alcohol dehydrogenase family)